MTRERSSASGNELLGQQVALFGECLLSEDGTPTKCEELDAALTQLQEMLGQNFSGFYTEDGAQRGQFTESGLETNNGCWPYK